MKRFYAALCIFLIFTAVSCVQKSGTQYLKKPQMTIGESVIIEFDDSRIINIKLDYPYPDECYHYKIDKIKVHNKTSKNSKFTEIRNRDVMVFKLEGNEDWLYLVCADYKDHGYIYIYDVSKESFYGDFTENEESGNYYKSQLINEYNILEKHQNIKRYGPLLEISFNGNVSKLWDSFLSGWDDGYRYQVVYCYPEYDEILLRIYYYEGGDHCIYSLRSNSIVCVIGGIPKYNNSRNAVFSTDFRYSFHHGFQLDIFTIRDGIYTNNNKLYKETPDAAQYGNVDGYWIDDNHFQVDYVYQNEYGSEQMTGSITAKREDQNSDFIIFK